MRAKSAGPERGPRTARTAFTKSSLVAKAWRCRLRGLHPDVRTMNLKQGHNKEVVMKRAIILGSILVLIVVASVVTVGAQSKTLASTMNIYVFPTKGQPADQQSQDEAGCYSWAVENTGNDPFDLAKKSEADKQQAQQAQEQAKNVGEPR